MIILGLNAYLADSAACLFVDGKFIAAAEEERFRRLKHWAGLPTNAIDYCLRESKLRLTDVDHVAINHKPRTNTLRRIAFAARHWSRPKLLRRNIANIRSATNVLEALQKAYGVELKAKLHHVEHDLAHLASTFLVSGFSEAACVSVDGFGDFTSTTIAFGRGDKIDIRKRVHFPHSLGIFYSALTQFLGFPHYGDEAKVMALAPYGEPLYLEQMREILRTANDGTFRLNLKYFRHHFGDVSYTWNDCTPSLGLLYRHALVDLLGPARQPNEPLEQRHKDIARSTQAMYEKAFFALLTAVHAQHPTDSLALAGSCATNATANGKIFRRTPFKKLYVPSAADDAGGALGAAAFVQSVVRAGEDRQSGPSGSAQDRQSRFAVYDFESKRGLTTANLGPWATDEELHALLDWIKKELSAAGCTVAILADEEELVRRTAEAIADGKIVGWFQGRMEWGPHALGHRSILADPRNGEMRDVLNSKIKRRESFRPFALSILREAVGEWCEQDHDVPFMTQTFQVRPAKRAFVPAVTHVDGSACLQTVHAETSPRYYRVIEKFRELTGIPLLLNASFSENEPLVCYPEEALDCFLRTNMDVLVLENFYLNRTR
jgi:carbamoyltransferase